MTDERMRTTWKQLARHAQKDEEWRRVWGHIAHAKKQANKKSISRKSRKEVRDEYRSLARKFQKLANAIAEGPLDLLAYNLLDQESLDALHVPDLYVLPEPQRGDAAYDLLHHWPNAPEILLGLQRRAAEFADEAMCEPRPDQRARGHVAIRLFVNQLGNDFRDAFGQPLMGTIAAITNVTFQTKANKEIDKKFVQLVLKRGVSKEG